MSSVLGPSYNYADHIKKPKDMGVSNSGNIFVSIRDLNAIYPYIDTLIYGKNVLSDSSLWKLYPLGNNFFIKSGTCGESSSEECKGKDRYIYIDNIPSGKIPCLKQIGIDLPNIAPFRGLVPGLLEDVAKINPIAMFNSLAGKGGISDKCSMRTENVGYEGKYTSVSKCSPPTPPIQCLPQFSEPFTNIEKKSKNKNKVNYIFLIAFFLIIILMCFLSSKK